MKRYFVDFYDAFDGWIRAGIEPEPEVCFDDLEKAKIYRDKEQSELNKDNIMMGEHYGIIDTKYYMEVECCQYET